MRLRRERPSRHPLTRASPSHPGWLSAERRSRRSRSPTRGSRQAPRTRGQSSSSQVRVPLLRFELRVTPCFDDLPLGLGGVGFPLRVAAPKRLGEQRKRACSVLVMERVCQERLGGWTILRLIESERTMLESEDEIRELQALIDRTFAQANPHLAGIVKPERRLTARQVVRYLQGTKHVAFGTVNERGQPRVAPLDGVFIRGRFTVSTGGRAARLRHLRANSACSAAHMDGDAIGIVVHGHATLIGRKDQGVEEIKPVWRDISGSSPFEWGEGVVFMRIEPTSMWTYAFRTESF